MILLNWQWLLLLLAVRLDLPEASSTAMSSITRERQLDVQYRSVLVVRILAAGYGDDDGSYLENELRNVLFDDASYSVQRQMQDCSGGRIILQLQRIVSVTVSSVSSTSSSTDAWVKAAAEQVLSEYFTMLDESIMGYKDQLRNLADHVILVLPETFPSSSFVANAEVGNSLCVFSIEWIRSLSAFMHEMGHNLGLFHSGLGDSQPYADKTGYMGVSTPIAWAPQKCYNAAQHWQLGWYAEHQWSLVNQDLSSPRIIALAAFPDHQKVSSSQYAILVQATESIYMQFNRAKSYNRGTDTMPDQVVVVRDDQDSTVLLAGLDMTNQNSLRLSSVVIQVCSLNINYSDESSIDFAIVAIAAYDNGALCSGSPFSTAFAAVQTPSPTSLAPTSLAPITPEPSSPPPTTQEPSSPPPTTQEPTTLRPVTTPAPTDSPVSQELPRTASPTDSFNAVIIKVPIFIETGDNSDRSYAKATKDRSLLRIGLMVMGASLLLVVVFIVCRRRRRLNQYRHPKDKQQQEDLEANSSPWTFWYWDTGYELDLGPDP